MRNVFPLSLAVLAAIALVGSSVLLTRDGENVNAHDPQKGFTLPQEEWPQYAEILPPSYNRGPVFVRVLSEEDLPPIQNVGPSYAGPDWDVQERKIKEQLSVVDVDDPHVKVQDVLRILNFCGHDYRAKILLIDGVDVLKRISDIFAYQPIWCESFLYEYPVSEELDVNIWHPVWGGYDGDHKEMHPLEVKKNIYQLSFRDGDSVHDFTHYAIDIERQLVVISSGFGDADSGFPLSIEN